MGELAHSDFQTPSGNPSLDGFSRSVLQLIADLPSCTEEKLFIVAVNRDLEGSRDLSLGDLKLLLHKCVQQLEAQGLLEIQAGELVTTEPGNGLLSLRGNAEKAPEPTIERAPASIPETGQAKGQTEPARPQADEGGNEADNNQIIAEPERAPREAQRKAEAAEEIVAYIRQIIKDHETGQAKGQAEPAQPQADEKEEILDLTAELGGLEIVEDNDPAAQITETDHGITPVVSDGGAAPAIEEEEILDLTAEDDDHPAVEVKEIDDDITPVVSDGGAAPAVEEEEILDLTAEDDDRPAVEIKAVDLNLDVGEPEPSALERAFAAFKTEHESTPTPLEAERVQKTGPQEAKAGAGVESNFQEREPASVPEPIGKPEESGMVLTATAAMMRDIVIALLLLALAATSGMSWFGGEPSLTTVLIMLVLLLVGSAVWGWRVHRR